MAHGGVTLSPWGRGRAASATDELTVPAGTTFASPRAPWGQVRRGSSSRRGGRDRRGEAFAALLVASPSFVAPFAPDLVKLTVPLVVIWVFAIARARLSLDVTLVAAGLTALAALSASLLAWSPSDSVSYGAFIATALSYIIAVRSFCSDSARVHRVLLALWLAGAFQAVLLLVLGRAGLGATDASGRADLGLVNPNVSGWILAVGIWGGLVVLLMPGSVLAGRRLMRLAVAAGLVPMLGALVASQSRTSFLSAVVAGAALVLLRRSAIVLHALGATVFALGVLVSLFPKVLIGSALAVSRWPVIADLARARGGFDGISNRQELWQVAHSLAVELPWHGAGPGTMVFVSGWELSTHNFILEAWIGMGWLGLMAYVALLLSILLAPLARGGQPDRQVVVGSGFLLLVPTLMGNTQHWTMTTCVVLGVLAADWSLPGSGFRTPWASGGGDQPRGGRIGARTGGRGPTGGARPWPTTRRTSVAGEDPG